MKISPGLKWEKGGHIKCKINCRKASKQFAYKYKSKIMIYNVEIFLKI